MLHSNPLLDALLTRFAGGAQQQPQQPAAPQPQPQQPLRPGGGTSWLSALTGGQNFANNPANGFQPTAGDHLQGIAHSMMQHYRGKGGEYGGPQLNPGVNASPDAPALAQILAALGPGGQPGGPGQGPLAAPAITGGPLPPAVGGAVPMDAGDSYFLRPGGAQARQGMVPPTMQTAGNGWGSLRPLMQGGGVY